MSLLFVLAGDRTSDGCLSCPGHTVQPEDAPFVTLISPCRYLLEDVDSGVWVAERVVLLVIRVEGCLGSDRQQLKKLRLVFWVPGSLEINTTRAISIIDLGTD